MSREDPDRQRRLAEALRTNLRRRKAQSRERETGEEANSPPQPDSPDSESTP